MRGEEEETKNKNKKQTKNGCVYKNAYGSGTQTSIYIEELNLSRS